MTKENIKPLAGLIIIDPETNAPLPAEGTEVILTKYWRRRIKAVDVEIVINKSTKNK
jgi:hypothetical protein